MYHHKDVWHQALLTRFTCVAQTRLYYLWSLGPMQAQRTTESEISDFRNIHSEITILDARGCFAGQVSSPKHPKS